MYSKGIWGEDIGELKKEASGSTQKNAVYILVYKSAEGKGLKIWKKYNAKHFWAKQVLRLNELMVIRELYGQKMFLEFE